MGEIAEMVLEGFLDEETGEVIDGTAPGYPRRMSGLRAPQGHARAPKPPPKHNQPLSAKDVRWLELAASQPTSGYPGIQWDMAPARFKSLERRGLVRQWKPHNPAHKTRAITTEVGRDAWLEAKGS